MEKVARTADRIHSWRKIVSTQPAYLAGDRGFLVPPGASWANSGARSPHRNWVEGCLRCLSGLPWGTGSSNPSPSSEEFCCEPVVMSIRADATVWSLSPSIIVNPGSSCSMPPPPSGLARSANGSEKGSNRQRPSCEPKAHSGSSLNDLLPWNRPLGHRRGKTLIGIAPISNGGCRCPGIGRVTIAIVIATVIGSRCKCSPEESKADARTYRGSSSLCEP